MEKRDIIRIEETGDKTLAYLKSGVSVECLKSLDKFEEETITGFFFRIHPLHLINLDFLSKIHLGSNPSIEMSDGKLLPLQAGRQSDLIKYFEKYSH
jgi:DNA-binding LytR/AlgR family response regulator